jgi:AcrR family transcriptional regulator
MATTPAKRSYDASRRRERADEERRATKRRVVDAARRLFVANGYSATTMNDIAKEAGVALQSVYKAGSSKAELLHVVVEQEVGGDDEDVMVADRAAFRAIGEASDPVRQVHLFADLIAAVQERSAPVQVAFRQAAAVDADIAANLADAHRRRLETFTVAIEMIPRKHLRQSWAKSADTAWAVGSAEVFHLLRNLRGWSAAQFRTWLRTSLVDLLLVPTTTE